MGAVEADGEEVLLHPGGIVPDEGVDVCRGGDLPSLGGQAPPPQLQGRADEGRLGGAEARDLDQLAVGHRRLAVEELHQIPGDGGDASPTVPASDEDGEELLVGE